MRLPAHASRRSRVLLTGAACLLAVVGLASPAAAAPPREDQKISAEKNAANQIAALQDIKKSQSPAEAKVDSKLVAAAAAGDQPHRRAARFRCCDNGVETTAAGKVLVDIRATVSDGLLKDLAAKGVDVRTVSTRYGSIRAEVPLAAVSAIAARADVGRSRRRAAR